MARHEHEKQVGMFFAQPLGQAGQDRLLAIVRATADEQRRALGDAQASQQAGNVQEPIPADPSPVEFTTAKHVHHFAVAPEFDQALGIVFALGTHAGEPGEEAAKQKTKAAIPVIRLAGDAGVYEEVRDIPGL